MTNPINVDKIFIDAINLEKLSSGAFVENVRTQLHQLADRIDDDVDFISIGAVIQKGSDTISCFEISGENTVPTQASLSSTTTHIEASDVDVGQLFNQLSAAVSGKFSEVETDEGDPALECQIGDEVIVLSSLIDKPNDDESIDEEEDNEKTTDWD